MTEDIASRLAALEARVGSYLPDPMERVKNRYEQAPWLRAMVLSSLDSARSAERSLPTVEEIEIIGQIDDRMADHVHDECERTKFSTELTIRIDSRGGDFDAAIRIYRALRWHGAARKTAYLGRHCQSAAAIVMLACDRRIASRHTVILFHGCASVPDPDEHWSIGRHLRAIQYLADLDARMLNLVADRTGLDLLTIAAMAGNEDPTPLDEALRLGLIHEVQP